MAVGFTQKRNILWEFLFIISFMVITSSAFATQQTFDQLSPEEKKSLATLEKKYFFQVRDESLPLLFQRLDTKVLIKEYTESIKIIRQRKRHLLLQIQTFFYAKKLNPEFIENYINRLERDVVYFALDAMIKKNTTLPVPDNKKNAKSIQNVKELLPLLENMM